MALIHAQSRDDATRSEKRSAAHGGWLPMAIIGKDSSTRSIKALRSDLTTAVADMKGHALLQITIDESAPVGAIVKKVQRDPVSRKIIHLVLQEVSASDSIRMSIPVAIMGQPESVAKGVSALLTGVDKLEIEAMASNLPEHIEVDVTGMDAEAVLHAGEITLPEGLVLISDASAIVVSTKPVSSLQAAAEAAEEAAAAEDAARASAAETTESE